MPPPPKYRTLGSYFRERFGHPVRKISLDAGFDCPNRDGTVGRGGCTFCLSESYARPRTGVPDPLPVQIARGKARLGGRDGRVRFAAYLQSFTNTHGDLERLRAVYDEAVADPDVVALFIGTRPDCVEDEKLDLIQTYAAERDVWVEYGLQTSSDETLGRLGRGHTFADFRDACRRTAARGLRVAVHLILGLPGEDEETWRKTAEEIAPLPLAGLKIHNLYVARGTPLEEEYLRGCWEPPDMEAAARGAVDVLERIPAHWVVQRLMSDPKPQTLRAPRPYWEKSRFLARVGAIFAERGTRQGSLSSRG
jgi:radical SAM protein (TIGR01212 family)